MKRRTVHEYQPQSQNQDLFSQEKQEGYNYNDSNYEEENQVQKEQEDSQQGQEYDEYVHNVNLLSKNHSQLQSQSQPQSQNFDQNQDQDQEQLPTKLPFSLTSKQLKPQTKNAYELTFKKQLNFQSNFTSPKNVNGAQNENSYHRSNQISMMNKKLFKQGQKYKKQSSNPQSNYYKNTNMYEENQQIQFQKLPQNLQSLLTKPLNYFYQMQIESLQNLPFFQMQSCILTNSQTLKKNIIGQILEVKRLKIKLHSAQINHSILTQKKDKNIQQKHKQYLMSLLKLQLNKKIFIQCLRMNVLQNNLKRSQIQEEKENAIAQQKNKNKIKSKSKSKSKSKQVEKNKNRPDQRQIKNLKQQVDQSQQVEQNNKDSHKQNKKQTPYLKQQTHKPKKQTSSDQVHQNFQDSFQLQQLKAKATVFGQIINTIFSKQVYLSFHQVLDYLKKVRKSQRNNFYKQASYQNSQRGRTFVSQIQKHSNESQFSHYDDRQKNENEVGSSQQINSKNQLKKYLIQNQKQSDRLKYYKGGEGESNPQNQQDSLTDEQKIKELITFLEQLQDELQNTSQKNYLKTYFLKWKIYYLNTILQEFVQKDQEEDDDNQQEQQYEESQDQNMTEVQQSEESLGSSGIYSSIIQHSQIQQQNYKSLKRQKKYLKYFLFRQNAFSFFDQFKQKIAQDKLKRICRILYEQNLIKRYFKGFLVNAEYQKEHIQMDEYYEDISNNQIEDNRTYDMFHQTTLIAKYFFSLKNAWKSLKLIKLMDKTTLKISFIKLVNFSNFQKKRQFNIQRFIQISDSKKKFRAFQGWKQKTFLDQKVTKVKKFRKQKDEQVIKHYFSILQLFYKKFLISSKKAIKHHKNQTIEKVFDYLKYLSMENRQVNQKSEELRDYLTFTRGNNFMINLKNLYTESLLYQRIKIKQNKLETNLNKSFIIERLKSWQTLTIKKQSYKAIEYRLIKLRERQVKSTILKTWYEQLLKCEQKKQEMDQSSQHKDWLVKYYGDLCSLIKH